MFNRMKKIMKKIELMNKKIYKIYKKKKCKLTRTNLLN